MLSLVRCGRAKAVVVFVICTDDGALLPWPFATNVDLFEAVIVLVPENVLKKIRLLRIGKYVRQDRPSLGADGHS